MQLLYFVFLLLKVLETLLLENQQAFKEDSQTKSQKYLITSLLELATSMSTEDPLAYTNINYRSSTRSRSTMEALKQYVKPVQIYQYTQDDI